MTLLIVNNNHTVCEGCDVVLRKGSVCSERPATVGDKASVEVVCLTCSAESKNP